MPCRSGSTPLRLDVSRLAGMLGTGNHGRFGELLETGTEEEGGRQGTKDDNKGKNRHRETPQPGRTAEEEDRQERGITGGSK